MDSELPAASDVAAQPGRRPDTVARGAALAFASKIVGGVFTAAITIFLARRLGVGDYGVFALAMSIMAVVELPSDFGVAVSLPRFLAEHRDDRRMMWTLVGDGIRLEALGSSVVAIGLVLAAGPLSHAYHAPGLALALRALAIALIGQNFLFLFSGVFTAMRRQASNVWVSLAESASELAATITFVLVFGGAAAAAFGRATGYLIGALVSLLLALGMLGFQILPRGLRPSANARRIVKYAANIWLIDGVYTAFTQIDAILIGALLTARSVSFFSAPMRLLVVIGYPGYAIASAVSPRLARTASSAPDRDSFRTGMRILTILMVVATLFTTVWATPIIHLTLGHGYGKAASVLRALAPNVLLSGAAALVSTALNYLGRARRRIPIAIATLLVNLITDAILIPQIGVVGGAIGTDLGMAVYVLAQLHLCNLELGTPAREQLGTLIRCLVAAAPAAAALLALGTHSVAVPVLIGGGIAAILIYVAGLVLTRELAVGELSTIASHARARIGSPLSR